MKFLLFFLMLIASATYALDADCPTKESISPCTCNSDDPGSPYGLIVCSNLKSIEEYEKIVNKSEDYPFTRVKFVNLSMLYFPINTQVQKRYHNMSIEDSTFAVLFKNLSHYDEKLGSISLKNVLLQRGLQWGLFKQFQYLYSLEIRDMDLNNIENGFEKAMSTYVQNVTFSNTKTLQLGNETFSKMMNLRNIAVTNNSIKSISRSMFTNYVLTMDFSNNSIESLPSDIFRDMSSLTEVSFINNKLTTVPQTVYGYLSSSTHVALEGNPIDCDCEMRWLTTVSSHAYITGICAGINTNKGKAIERLLQSDFTYCERKGKNNFSAPSKNTLTA